MSNTDTVFAGLSDDAAVFPPGNVPLQRAVPADVQHKAAAHAGIVGPFVPAAKDLVELPRDGRRASLVDALADTSYQAKLRTGGVRADMYPDETELAAAVVALIAAGVPFKATAVLHRAIRHTDPATGFEQHGFLNPMIATQAAADGADVTDVAGRLADRDPARQLAAARLLDSAVRQWFSSFGTCSISEPVEDLVALGLLSRDDLTSVPA